MVSGPASLGSSVQSVAFLKKAKATGIPRITIIFLRTGSGTGYLKNEIPQSADLEGLGNEIRGAAFERLLCRFHCCKTSNDDDLCGRRMLLDIPHHIKPVGLPHLHVRNHEVEMLHRQMIGEAPPAER
jgi:hypothetical protein